jgi:cell division protein FtsX
MSRLLPSVRETWLEHPTEVAATVLLVAFALSIPNGLYFVGTSVRAAVGDWLEQFRPVVYLEVDRSSEEARRLRDELRGWEHVDQVHLRKPEEGLDTVRERLGSSAVSDMELVPSMFPTSLIVEPATDPGERLELTSRIAALETRDGIRAVSLPSSETQSQIEALQWGLWGAVGLGVMLIGLAWLQLRNVVDRCLRELDDTIDMLARHGLAPDRLRDRCLVWGGSIGLAGGLVGAGLLLVVAMGWYRFESQLFGGEAALEAPWRWATIIVPLLFGPILGGGAGWWSARRLRSTHFGLPVLSGPMSTADTETRDEDDR